FDFDRADQKARKADGVALASLIDEAAVLAQIADVAGAEIAFAVDGLGGGFGVVQITDEVRVGTYFNGTALTNRQQFATIDVTYADLRAGMGGQAAAFQVFKRIAARAVQ